MINPKTLPKPLVKGVAAVALIGAGTLYFGRDTLYFPNGSGGDQWRIGRAQIHVLNAHGKRSTDDITAKALALVNRDRTLNNLEPLQLDPRLSQVAQDHAVDMAQQGYFGSVSPEGTSLGDRLRSAGETAWVGENLLVGEDWGDSLVYRHVEQLERQGMYHRGHRENLLNPDHTHVGFGIVADPSTEDVYAVQLFRGGMPGAIARATAQGTTASAANGSKADDPSADGSGSTPQSTEPQVLQVQPSDPFRDAVNAATVAANLTQTAKTAEEWAAVAGQWQSAITNMQAVPQEHPRYTLAQQKAQEYGNNLAYAKQNSNNAVAAVAPTPTEPAPQTPATTPAIAAVSPPNTAEAITPTGSTNLVAQVIALPSSAWLKIGLTLVGGTVLAVVLSAGPTGLSKSEEKDIPPPPKKLKQNIPWSVILANAVHDLWELQPFFRHERVYKMTAATSAHKLQRKLYRRLLSLTDDQAMAMQLIKENLRRHPRQSVNWCCEQAIKDLEKQRQRENTMQQEKRKFGEISLPGVSETPDV